MKYRIEQLEPKKLIGLNIAMSLVQNKTFQLWQSFMPRRKEILKTVSDDLFSIQLYSAGYFENFNPMAEFVKWSCVEVESFEIILNSMEILELKGGLYAVFNYKGDGSNASETFQYIFENVIPASNYQLDNQLHFELLGKKYKSGNSNSEEEIWIPVKLKSKVS